MIESTVIRQERGTFHAKTMRLPDSCFQLKHLLLYFPQDTSNSSPRSRSIVIAARLCSGHRRISSTRFAFPEMASPSDRVFGTYELLEKTLVAVACPRSMFVIQRVCKAWQAIIRRSTTIQKLLFLLPDGRFAHPTISLQDLWENESNPEFLYEHKLEFNDFAPRHFKHIMSEEESVVENGVKVLLGWACAFDLLESDEKASYRLSYLAQPPVTHGYLIVSEVEDRGGQELHMNLYNPRGLTFGDLEDVAAKVATQRKTWPPKRVCLFCGFDVWDDGTYAAPKVNISLMLDTLFDGV